MTRSHIAYIRKILWSAVFYRVYMEIINLSIGQLARHLDSSVFRCLEIRPDPNQAKRVQLRFWIIFLPREQKLFSILIICGTNRSIFDQEGLLRRKSQLTGCGPEVKSRGFSRFVHRQWKRECLPGKKIFTAPWIWICHACLRSLSNRSLVSVRFIYMKPPIRFVTWVFAKVDLTRPW